MIDGTAKFDHPPSNHEFADGKFIPVPVKKGDYNLLCEPFFKLILIIKMNKRIVGVDSRLCCS